MAPVALAEKKITLYNDKDLSKSLSNNLKEETIDNTAEIEKYIKLIG